jgi:hypothetical protein
MTRTLMTVSILGVLASPASALWGETVMKCGDDLYRFTKYFSEPKIEKRVAAQWQPYCPNYETQKFLKSQTGGVCSWIKEEKISRMTNSDECMNSVWSKVECKWDSKTVSVPIEVTIDFEYLTMRFLKPDYSAEGFHNNKGFNTTVDCVEQ